MTAAARPRQCGANASHGAERRSYSAVMARRTQQRCIPAAGHDAVLAQLRSSNARARVRALHCICPCSAGFQQRRRSQRPDDQPRFRGHRPGDETPLHYAASSDDADVAEALIDGGADIEAPDGSIGTPLDNAVGYSCWHVARLLVARGTRVDKAWHAAALGMLSRLEELLGTDPPAQDVSQAFWHACAGSQRRAAEYLLSRGADLGWEPDYAHGTPLDAASGLSTRRENVISWLRDLGARSASSD